jgi:hypothetical protein
MRTRPESQGQTARRSFITAEVDFEFLALLSTFAAKTELCLSHGAEDSISAQTLSHAFGTLFGEAVKWFLFLLLSTTFILQPPSKLIPHYRR